MSNTAKLIKAAFDSACNDMAVMNKEDEPQAAMSFFKAVDGIYQKADENETLISVTKEELTALVALLNKEASMATAESYMCDYPTKKVLRKWSKVYSALAKKFSAQGEH